MGGGVRKEGKEKGCKEDTKKGRKEGRKEGKRKKSFWPLQQHIFW